MYQIAFTVPETHVEEVKEALFAKGAGEHKDYKRVSWQTLGTGQFEPQTGSDPFIGEPGKLETVKEYRVEMACRDEFLREVLDQLVSVHPYEEVAYYAVKIVL
jgi:structural toxin protein (hemagglutinin/hemolysin) RtxA